MEGKLDIQQSVSGKQTLLTLSGRLDANWAGQLADTVNALTREGIYDVSLDLTNVVYLSSAGIRVLVMQYKNLDRLGGSLTLAALSDPVRDVLQMVGMTEMMSKKPEKAKAPDAPVSPGMAREGFQFTRESTGSAQLNITVHGDPEISNKKIYSDKDNLVIKADGHCFALGLGAIGTGFEDCKSRYGEFLALGDAVTYMPADQSSIPDYAIASGQYVPSINALFAIRVSGEFSDRVIFEPAAGTTSIPLHKLIDVLFSLTGYIKLALLMAAESDGLIGMRLRKSPVTDPSLLELPGLRDNLFFTTEPAYSKMLTVSFGYFEKISGTGASAYVRPTQNGSSVAGHLHSAVFPYQPLKKSEPDYHEIIRSLFGDSEVIDILHLLNDTREINGLGDSRFKNGICWIGRIG
jgi:anti-anti-sigma factor